MRRESKFKNHKGVKTFLLTFLFYNVVFLHSEENTLFTPNPQTEEIIMNDDFKNEIRDSLVLECKLKDISLKISILKNGKAYIIDNDKVINIPFYEDFHPEETSVSCFNNEISITTKSPLSNNQSTYVFTFEKGKIHFIRSRSIDKNFLEIEKLFEEALKGKKNHLVNYQLQEFPFSYQYINSELIQMYLQKALQIPDNNPDKKNIFDAVGILSTKIISYYYSNKELTKEQLENYEKWIEYWNLIGVENYEDFLLEYAKGELDNNKIKIIQMILQKNPQHFKSYLFLGDIEWSKNQHTKAIELYKKAIEILNSSGNSYQIPSSILKRIELVEKNK